MRHVQFLRVLCACMIPALLIGPAFAQTPPQGDDPLAALKKLLTEHPELVDQLKALLDQMQKGKPTVKPPDEPDVPKIELPGEPGKQGQPVPTPTITPTPTGTVAGQTRASLTPDISVIGNHIGRFISVGGDGDRNRFQLGEIEIGLQQPIFTGMRFDAFINGGADDGFKMGAEEAYVTMSKIGHLPFGAYLGKKRLDFGKINPVHPHSRLYADQPAPLAYLVGSDSLNGNGAALTYLLPVKGIFANLEAGFWKTSADGSGMTNPTPAIASRTRALTRDGLPGTFYPTGMGVTGNVPLARLWMSKEMGKGSEMELGASHAFGKTEIGDNVKLTGLDFTYKSFPSTFKRLMAQGEIFWHQREDRAGGTGNHTRSGHYGLLSYRPDQYIDYGLRYDNTRLPWPFDGREQTVSLIWSDKLTEVTLLRLQIKHGDRTSDVFLPARRGFTEAWLQFIWGAGSHTHSLQ